MTMYGIASSMAIMRCAGIPPKYRIFTICLKKSAAITRTRRSYASSLLVQEPYNEYGDLNVRPGLAAEANYTNR